MSTKKYFSLLVVTTFILIACKQQNSPQKLLNFNNLNVGDPVPSFTALSENGIYFSEDFSEAEFYVYFIDDKISLICFNEECGININFIKQSNGQFIGGSDAKFAKFFGVEILSGNPYQLTNSLLVLADKEAKITSFYKGVKKKDINDIVKKELEKDSR